MSNMLKYILMMLLSSLILKVQSNQDNSSDDAIIDLSIVTSDMSIK